MGWRLGIRKKGDDPYADIIPEESALVQKLNIYPDVATITQSDWKKIIAYFEHEAPEEPLPQQNHDSISGTLALFSPKQIVFDDKQLPNHYVEV